MPFEDYTDADFAALEAQALAYTARRHARRTAILRALTVARLSRETDPTDIIKAFVTALPLDYTVRTVAAELFGYVED